MRIPYNVIKNITVPVKKKGLIFSNAEPAAWNVADP
jgi:hypothetical protein